MDDYKFKPWPDWPWFKKKIGNLSFLLNFKLHLSPKRGKIAPWFDEKLFFTDKLKKIMISKTTVLRFFGLLLFVGFGSLSAQQFAELKVKVTDDKGKVVKGATVSAKQGDIERDAGTSNSDGNVYFTTLIPGVYEVVVDAKEGKYAEKVELGIGLNEDIIASLRKVGDLGPVIITVKSKKATDLLSTKKEISGSSLLTGGGRGLSGLTRTNAAINTANGATSVRGSRTDASGTFIDGMRIGGGGSVPSLGIQSVSVQVGGIPAQYGDLTGGAFTYTTKNATRKLVGAAEAITSTGLDPYGHNIIEGFISGPLWKKKYTNSRGKTDEYVKLGFTLNGNIGYYKDPNPTRTGVFVVKGAKLQSLEQNPLTITPQGFVHNASFLTDADIENVKARPNSALGEGNFIGKLEFSPNNNIKLTGYGSYFYNTGRSASNDLMNFKNNGRFDNNTIRSYLMFTQKFQTDEESTLKDAFYTVRAEYQNITAKSRDANHLDNIFDYGYVGKFTRYQTERYAYDNYDNNQNPNRTPTRVVDQNGDVVELTNAWYHEGYVDTLMTFQGSDLNAVRAKYTQNVYDFFDERGGRITNPTQVQVNQGLLNGFNPNNVYSLWGTPGGIASNFSKSQQERYSLFALGQLKYQPKSIGGKERTPHDIQVGFFYEQRISRAYGLGANGLWPLMGQLANNHIGELDRSVAYLNYDANGVFGDTVRYNRLINYSEQSTFDRNLRTALIEQGAKDVYGQAYTQSTFIDVNSLDPSTFKLDYFSADELLNNGNSRVSYYGYDHLGNKVNGKPDIDAFLKDPAKRTIGAFQPVYIAAWIQDQVKFRNLVFRGGVRMERYDANQLVVKDPYSLYPVKTAGEVKDINGLSLDHPSNIGNDFKVYVNNIKNPTKIIGYRNGDRWFNADGSEQKNPEFLANQTNNGRIAPYLIDPNQEDITKETFADFTPVINVLPRLWFSFPLVPNEKSFYVSYDVLAQRPNQGASFLTIDEIFFLKNRQGRTISNGNLQPRLKTDYEIGYKQLFGRGRGKNVEKNMALELAASYSEVRQDFGLYQISNGYPVTYTTYRNIDFSTITGFRAAMYANDIGPLSLSVSYQLQFADGTGSNINSQQALIQSNQPNLRNVIPLGSLDVRHSLKTSATFAWSGGIDPNTRRKRYEGPANLEKYLQYSSINIISNAYSGLPYTPTINPVQIGAVQRAQIKGSPFGARMPWQNTFDINITKGFLINRKTKDNPLVMSVFIWVQNVLNTKNTVGVFPYTGAALDDGFLNSPAGQLVVESQVSAQSYVDLYKTLLNSFTGNFARPRSARVGVRFNFN